MADVTPRDIELSLRNAEAVFMSLLPKFRKNIDNIEKGRFDKIEEKDSFNSIYTDAIKQVMRIKPHSSTEYFPEKLFAHLSPHRRNDEAEWIKNNYKPVTLPVWMDFMSAVTRGCNPNNYKVIWGEVPEEYQGENSPENYVNDQIKLYTSLHAWFNNTLFDIKLKDANGCVAVKPYSEPYVDMETEDGQRMRQVTEWVEPVPIYYPSRSILAFEEDEYYLVHDQKRVRIDGVKSGHVFYYFDKMNIIRIQQYGNYSDWKFDFDVYYAHGWQSVPVWKLKGKPEVKDYVTYFQSPFDFAVGNLDLAAMNQINKQMAEANSAWPHKIMVAETCDAIGDDGNACTNGLIGRNIDGEIRPITCGTCNGTGIKNKPSPGSTTIVNPERLNDEGNVGMDRIRFVSPGTEVLKHLQESVEQNKDEARSILHLYSSNAQSSGTAETATGIWNENNNMIAFIMPIISEGFDIYEGVLQAIVYMRYSDKVAPPTIVRPTDFHYKTSADYLAEYTSLLNQGAPPVVLYKVLEKYIERMFYSAGDDKKVFKLILASDPHVAKKDDEIRNMLGARTMEKWEAVLHAKAFYFINELIQENEQFLEQDLPIQKQQLIDKAKAAAAAIETSEISGIIDGIAGVRTATQ